MRSALLLITAAAVLAGCQREWPPNPNDTRAMGAARPVASAPAAKSSAPTPPSSENLNAGRTIAGQGAPGAPACASCHGPNGEGNAPAGIPRLAGLGRPYIEHQLDSYADGTRANPVMTPVAGALSVQQRSQVAAFFASLGAAATPPVAAASAPAVVAHGDDRRGVQACMACHGPQGAGDAAAMPYLAGQNGTYLATALAAWKNGTRHNDASGRMPAMAKALTDEEVRDVVAYYASLPPPAARP